MWYLVANPRSAGGKTNAILPDLLAILRRRLPPFHTLLTHAPQDAIRLARDAASQGADVVIALGGDGTTSEVVNGLMQAHLADPSRPIPRLGLLPQGTGGDFRRSFFPEHRLDLYLQALTSDHLLPLDIGLATYTDPLGSTRSSYFLNVLSAGLGGIVDRLIVEHSQQKGSIAYALASARALLRSEAAHLRLSMHTPDGLRSFVLPSRNLAICNGRFFGGGMKIAPHADLADGWFEIVNFSPLDRLSLLPIAAALYQGSLSSMSHVQHFRARQISIDLLSSSSSVLLDIDGEPLGQLPLSIDLLPHALSLLALPP